MSGVKFVLDRKGVGQYLKSAEVGDHITAVARQVASTLGPDAFVTTYTTDRRAASVSIPAWRQAKAGALLVAATSVGLEVRPR
ncbi:hypothetical protein ACHMZP_21750 [Rhodococcus baikonurensis]|uniref:hypothetical protein n=1 Tax=Rhodococcus baikonurensis TaxID=172041 RepID=UPI0037B527A8